LSTSLATGLGLVDVVADTMHEAIVHLANSVRRSAPGGALHIETHNISVGTGDAHADSPTLPGEYVCLTLVYTTTGFIPDVPEHPVPSNQRMQLFIGPLYAFAKKSGGRVTMDSDFGRGTILRIYLPCGPQKTGADFVEDRLDALRRNHLGKCWQGCVSATPPRARHLAAIERCGICR